MSTRKPRCAARQTRRRRSQPSTDGAARVATPFDVLARRAARAARTHRARRRRVLRVLRRTLPEQDED